MTHPDSDALVGLLPHRPPFRFVDVGRRGRRRRAASSRARTASPATRRSSPGHFPGNPIVPGRDPARGARAGRRDRAARRRALRGQAARCSAASRRCASGASSRPGDELAARRSTIERLSARGGWAQARATVDGDTACEARLFFAHRLTRAGRRRSSGRRGRAARRTTPTRSSSGPRSSSRVGEVGDPGGGTSPVGSSGLRWSSSFASTSLSIGGSSRTCFHGRDDDEHEDDDRERRAITMSTIVETDAARGTAITRIIPPERVPERLFRRASPNT